MKLKFIQDAYVNGVHVYSKGEIYEIDNSLGSADRWLRRGIAEEVIEMAQVEEQTKEEDAPSIKEEVTFSKKGRSKKIL